MLRQSVELTPGVLSGIAEGWRGRVRALIGIRVGVAVHIGGRGDGGGALVIGLERR